MEVPYSGRAILNDNLNGFEITIPTKKNWFLTLFLGVWLYGWGMGEFSAIDMFNGFLVSDFEFFSFFIIIWLCVWSVAGFFVFKTIIWNLTGKEVITFGQGQLTIEKKGSLFSKPKSYDLKEVTKFRVKEEENKSGFWGVKKDASNGTIRFDYGMKTVKFGIEVEEAEAYFIIDTLKSKKILTEENYL